MSAVLDYPHRHAISVDEYARHGVPEAWVVDLQDRCVRVFRDPTASGYRTRFTVSASERVTALAPAHVVVDLSAVLPS
jgi:hypothetical protein